MALSLDGTATGTTGTGTVTTSTLTTSAGSGQIVVGILANASSVTSVTATGLTFAPRTTQTNGFGFSLYSEYVAPYTSNFSGTITVVVSAAVTTNVIAWGIGGAVSTASGQFDTHSGIPATNGNNGSVSITTSNANDFVFAILGLTGASTAGSGWTAVANIGTQMLVEYQIVSATGTFTASVATGGFNDTIVDAIVAGAATAAIGTTIILMGVG